MKIVNGEDTIIYLPKEYLNIDLKDSEDIDKFINKINNKYSIKLSGYYEVIIYKDDNYGIIIEMKKDDLEYIDYFDDIAMNIKVINDSFLYKIEDIKKVEKIKNKVIIYQENENLYLKAENLSNIEKGILLESSDILYGSIAKEIISKSRVVNAEVII